jgi:cellulose synthase/poly-beta-1,6-N-acetylglucosamine synthase-like glycosyltransferase
MIDGVYAVVCLSMLGIMLFLIGYHIHALWIARRREMLPENKSWPRVVLVIPCKGVEPGLEEHLRRHFHHDYPDYEIIFSVARADDPAGALLHTIIATETGRTGTIVSAPPLPDCVEKVSNQVGAFRAVGADREVIVCADTDGLARDSLWLRSLVAGLERCALISGFRWYVPEGPSFAGRLQSAWDTNWFLLHALGKTAWGGAMAFRRDTARRLAFDEHLCRGITDDLVLQVCVQRGKERTGFTPGGMVLSKPAERFGDFFRWAVRQSQIVRLTTPAVWLMGFATANVYAAFLLLSLVFLFVPATTWGWRWPAAALAVVAVYYLLRGYLTYHLATIYLPDHRAKIACLRWTYYWALPVADLLAFAAAHASWLYGVVRWRGISYRMKAGRVVRL